MYVSVTALKTRGFFSAIRFWLLAVPTFRQAKSSKGVLFCEVKTVDGFHHTLTAWETKKEMKVFPKIATGSTIGYEADEIPSWSEALENWRKQAVNYT